MSKIGKIVSNFLLKMFPQSPPEFQTDERLDFEKGGIQFRGIKGNKDKITMIEGVRKRNSGN